MADFTLNTAGVFYRLGGSWRDVPGANVITWETLDAFTQGYVEAAFASLVQTPSGKPSFSMSGDGGSRQVVGFSDLAPETLAEILKDCAAWREEFTGKTREASALRADMGREFWRIRQEGKRRTFPPLTPTLGDDGKVYLKPQP